ncbi:MAG: glycosyltransferase [Desmonostoc vinosum HA7617-LM4]|jgi:glycosyltransferase involved in cell wall biosynthesis|nr:glycosyltransferase [Desmonostoc vinosum HA7617-LM4]
MSNSITSLAPIVSVMMPTYNVKKYVKDAIDSVLKQTFANWELIIVDDGSTDGTTELVAQYAEKDSRIKVYYQEHFGRGKTRNKCLEYSRGKYIAICDSDDISLPERFEKQVNFLENNFNIGAIGSQVCSFSEEAIFDPAKIIYWPTEAGEVCQGFKQGKMKMANCATMIRTSLFEEHGGYCEQLHRAQDYEFFSRVIRKGISLANLPEVLVFYRQSNYIQPFQYYKENEIYYNYANFLLSGGTQNFHQFSQKMSNKLRHSYLVQILNYWRFFMIMSLKKLSIYRMLYKKNKNLV